MSGGRWSSYKENILVCNLLRLFRVPHFQVAWGQISVDEGLVVGCLAPRLFAVVGSGNGVGGGHDGIFILFLSVFKM